MQSVSSELSRYPFVCAGGRSFPITCSGVFILDEVIGMKKKIERQTPEKGLVSSRNLTLPGMPARPGTLHFCDKEICLEHKLLKLC